MLCALQSQHAVFGSQELLIPANAPDAWVNDCYTSQRRVQRIAEVWELKDRSWKTQNPQMKITHTVAARAEWEWGAPGRWNCLFAHPAPLLSVGDQEAPAGPGKPWVDRNSIMWAAQTNTKALKWSQCKSVRLSLFKSSKSCNFPRETDVDNILFRLLKRHFLKM